ncbi:hypothetical protein [Bifidobacterium olomucense]|uniref:Uncharacterized protein n=1 Tax=Bifidobacterium olomucense TaxID=2675324 RepID=A0A7Y0EW64_9BIFI|nr:hypothetical protein [Bifidobacterium sp. DSM 109959]NMM97523.1 hypothetical protein [Bifidobacterium sp. DSM 109959]
MTIRNDTRRGLGELRSTIQTNADVMRRSAPSGTALALLIHDALRDAGLTAKNPNTGEYDKAYASIISEYTYERLGQALDHTLRLIHNAGAPDPVIWNNMTISDIRNMDRDSRLTRTSLTDTEPEALAQRVRNGSLDPATALAIHEHGLAALTQPDTATQPSGNDASEETDHTPPTTRQALAALGLPDDYEPPIQPPNRIIMQARS